jgi:hypothetical protein
MVRADADKQPLRPNWCLLVDEMTGTKSSSFHETKNKMIEPVCAKLHNWKEHGMQVQILRMDNGGENQKLVQRLNSKDWKLYPTIEYTARDTPQHNHLAEVEFATLYGRDRAMMKAASIRALVWLITHICVQSTHLGRSRHSQNQEQNDSQAGGQKYYLYVSWIFNQSRWRLLRDAEYGDQTGPPDQRCDLVGENVL